MKSLVTMLAGVAVLASMCACQTDDGHRHHGKHDPNIHGPRLDGYVPPAQRNKPTPSLNHLPKLPTAGPHRF
ncbi:MAG: hypothetical protein E7031_04480 [Akkermansiaceae bacterium]|nr:hypothetical protein [Akkermansiaceae bacterium]